MQSVKGAPDFVIWTGDSSPLNEEFPFKSDDLHMSQDFVFQIVQNQTETITATFPATKIIPCIGNHEIWPPSQLKGPNSKEAREIFSTIADMWEPLIGDAAAVDEFRRWGWYTITPVPGLRVLVLNTLWCDAGNVRSWVHLDGDGNQEMFDWATQVLADASAAKEIVWVVGHVPMAAPHVVPACAQAWKNITLTYSDVIAMQLAGHTHKDTFTVFLDAEGTAVNTLFITPSLTPESWHQYGHNPSARLFSYDADTLLVTDFSQYYMNLSKANEDGAIQWMFDYSALEEYGMHGFTPADWYTLSQLLAKDDATFELAWDHSNTRVPTACTGRCRAEFVCQSHTVTYDEYHACLQEAN
eukprot:TRINITY_DN5554_c0_g1_i1.p1 TRINITY_DN5554_c0_g1~~TRINITY_DN5554_c0_g1_i1.p1  ORF type:complete len:356 (-),score=80.50 TRINITY_DN5554_c0_g1_i1:102-1169(-)